MPVAFVTQRLVAIHTYTTHHHSRQRMLNLDLHHSIGVFLHNVAVPRHVHGKLVSFIVLCDVYCRHRPSGVDRYTIRSNEPQHMLCASRVSSTNDTTPGQDDGTLATHHDHGMLAKIVLFCHKTPTLPTSSQLLHTITVQCTVHLAND